MQSTTIFAANKNNLHLDNSMHDKWLEYYNIRYQITNPIQTNPRARQQNDLDLVGNELLLHCLRLSHLPSQHVFPWRFCLLSFENDHLSPQSLSDLILVSSFQDYEIFLLHTFSLGFFCLQMFVFLFSISGPQPHLNLYSICFILYWLQYFYLF